MTAPQTVRTDWHTAQFNPGNGLPMLRHDTPVLISDQPTLTAVLAAASAAGVGLEFIIAAQSGSQAALAAKFSVEQLPALLQFENRQNVAASPLALDTGQAVTAFGGGAANGFISGGLLQHTPVASQQNSATHWEAAALDSTVVRIGGNAVFPAGATGGVACIIPSGSWATTGVSLPAGVHLVLYSTSWHCSYWDGAAEQIYASGVFATPLVADGVTKHRIEAFVDITTSSVYIRLPDGAGRKVVKVTDARIAAHLSAYPNWEIYEDNSANNAVPAMWADWWAGGSQDKSIGARNAQPSEVAMLVADQPPAAIMTSFSPATTQNVNDTTSDVERARATVTVPASKKMAVIVSDYLKVISGANIIYSVYLQTHGTTGLGAFNSSDTVFGTTETTYEGQICVMFDSVDMSALVPGQLADIVIAGRSSVANSETWTADNSGRRVHVLAMAIDAASADTTTQ